MREKKERARALTKGKRNKKKLKKKKRPSSPSAASPPPAPPSKSIRPSKNHGRTSSCARGSEGRTRRGSRCTTSWLSTGELVREGWRRVGLFFLFRFFRFRVVFFRSLPLILSLSSLSLSLFSFFLSLSLSLFLLFSFFLSLFSLSQVVARADPPGEVRRVLPGIDPAVPPLPLPGRPGAGAARREGRCDPGPALLRQPLRPRHCGEAPPQVWFWFLPGGGNKEKHQKKKIRKKIPRASSTEKKRKKNSSSFFLFFHSFSYYELDVSQLPAALPAMLALASDFRGRTGWAPGGKKERGFLF